jgi:hypothetical protein
MSQPWWHRAGSFKFRYLPNVRDPGRALMTLGRQKPKGPARLRKKDSLAVRIGRQRQIEEPWYGVVPGKDGRFPRTPKRPQIGPK